MPDDAGSLQHGVCPYCGAVTPSHARCAACGGRLDPLSRQATQNAMGPWYVRDESNPFRPGCSFETLATLVERGLITRNTIVRGPGTLQFWRPASRTPGLSRLLGICHNCQIEVRTDEFACRSCGAFLDVERDRQHLGLGPVRKLPGATASQATFDTAPPKPGDDRNGK